MGGAYPCAACGASAAAAHLALVRHREMRELGPVKRSRVGWSGLAVVVSLVAGGDARAQEPAPPPPAPQAPAPPPEAWFPQLERKRTPPPEQAPSDGGAYVIEPTAPPPPPPPPPESTAVAADPTVEDEVEGVRDGGLVLGMLAVRPYFTWLDGRSLAGASPDAPDDGSTGVVAGHVGIRGHGTGVDDDFMGRADIEAFVGASTEGVEGEGKGFLSFGLATPIERIHFLFFRFGAGGTLFGNPLLDYQVAELPALELGYLHVGADGFIEVAPRVAMGVLAVHAGDRDILEPDPAPAVGGRLLAGADSLWATADYEVVTGDRLVHLAYLTACYAQKFSLCLDGRLAVIDGPGALPQAGAGGPSSGVTALSGGISFGLGVAEQED